jgi:RNase P/RNase MRP subunit p29
MATRVQLRRGTTTEHSTFTGAAGEVTVDTTKNTVVVHNNSTAGGVPLLKESAIGVSVQAYDADTAKTDVAQSFTAAQRGAITALTDGATITPDFSLSNNWSLSIGGNRTLANPTNLTAGQSGCIYITQTTGSHTLAYGSNWDFAGGTAPTLSTAASAVDVLVYAVRTTGSIAAQLIKDVK